MDNLARKQESTRPELEYGHVVSTRETVKRTVRVATSLGEIEAQRAVGCLVCPEEGDSVLVSLNASGKAWILSVLARNPDVASTPTALELEGDSILRVTNGGLTIAPETEFSCVTGKAMLHAGKTSVSTDQLSLVTRLLNTQAERVKSVAGMVDAISREFTRRVSNYFRFTKDHEDCQAKSRRQLVDETMTIQSKNAVIVSEEQVKIDGELIHMG